jgi:hypothetical protein
MTKKTKLNYLTPRPSMYLVRYEAAEDGGNDSMLLGQGYHTLVLVL